MARRAPTKREGSAANKAVRRTSTPRTSRKAKKPAAKRSTATTSTRVTRGKLDVSALESWLWEAACAIRGPVDAPKFKDFILPLVFFKRLSDVFDDEFAAYVTQYEGKEIAWAVIEADHADALARS